jgi:hypothetical protein
VRKRVESAQDCANAASANTRRNTLVWLYRPGVLANRGAMPGFAMIKEPLDDAPVGVKRFKKRLT